MYHLGVIGYGSLQEDLRAWWAKLRGKEDPNARIGEESRIGKHGEFWALRDINLEIKEGEAVGIIGPNGAGKSTLLKIISRITAPTTGRIGIKGRVASLLEVGTGFHPELTGRENIFMNGAILGMKRREIQRKFDEIVEFAGVADFIDTPVKRYSSGMYVRLAFAVAAHLDSDILIVDEVLAVGDAEFQRKCQKKINSVNYEEGRTTLFVSHNMATVKKLCSKGVLIKNGKIERTNNIDDVLKYYQSIFIINTKNYEKIDCIDLSDHPNREANMKKYLRKIRVLNKSKSFKTFYYNEPVEFILEYDFKLDIILNPEFSIYITCDDEHRVISFINGQYRDNIPKEISGKGVVTCKIKNFPLFIGNYNLHLRLWTPGKKLDDIPYISNFEVKIEKNILENQKWETSGLGDIISENYWEIIQDY